MKRVLFVDDEEKILDGLKRLLRPLRKEWHTVFVTSAGEALEMLSHESFDVIVSDMRMPGMDGAALLTEVMRRFPQLVRIVLSGHSSEEASLRSAGVAHQFLAKPCDADTLKHTINHACALRSLMSNEKLTGILSQLKSVPSMSALYTEIIEELRYPDASITHIGEIVAKDPGMTAKILQLVNSAFFGLPRAVSDPAQAASLLGAEVIKALVLSLDVFSQFEEAGVAGNEPETIQKHCSETALISKQIASTQGAELSVVDASFMAGFLHDVGKLILVQNLPDEYGRVIQHMQETGAPLCSAEKEILGATHAEAGAYLLGLWGLPDTIVEATAFHHCPHNSCGKTFAPLTAVHVADALAHEGESDCGPSVQDSMDLDYLNELGLAEQVAVWRAGYREACQGGVQE